MTAPGPVPEPVPATSLGWRAASISYVSYVAGVVLATWPLARDPARFWAYHHDPPLFTWVMASMARWLAAGPRALFDGNAFYPYGGSLAFSEPLLLPAVLGLPGFVAGNPVLTYNLMILLLWPANGLAMAWAAWELTRSRRAAWLAGAVFSLSPYFVVYQIEFNMLPAAPVPVALVAWVRWLERQQARWLALSLGALVTQGFTSWYYTIATGLGLVTLTLGFACLRWRGWRWRRDVGALLVGGVAVALLLLPVAWPYVVVRGELGLERDLRDTVVHHVDLLQFVESVSRFPLVRAPWHAPPAETSPFVGFSVLALGALALARGWAEGRPRSGGPAWLARGAGVLLVLAVAGVVVTSVHGRSWRLEVGQFHRHVGIVVFLWLVLAMLAGLLLARGWSAARARAPRELGPGDWAWLLALLTAVSVVLVLGPVVHVAGRPVGRGPYGELYRVLFPLHAVRITVRFAILAVAALGLLGAFGWRGLEARMRVASLRRLCFAGLVVVMMLEYAVRPHDLVEVGAPRPVDLVLRADPADVAVLEWPVYSPGEDADAMFRSLYHGKRVVNGFSGFRLASLRELSTLLTRPGRPFPSAEAQAALREIHPLRYLVVRRTGGHYLQWWAAWLEARSAPSSTLRFRGTHGTADLYEVIAEPDRGTRLERHVSGGFLLSHPQLELEVAPLGVARPGGPDSFVDVRLNSRGIARLALGETGTTLRTRLAGDVRRAAPNVFALDYGYAWPPAHLGPRHRIGRTGVLSPGDLRVSSSGGPRARPGSRIALNGVELSPNRRGYNLVALGADGRPRAATVFDTFAAASASAALADWIRALPAGTIVAAAVRDEASAHLDAEAIAALRSLGVGGDLRGRFRAAHAFVGVKGAAPGTAAESLGPEEAEVQVGDPPREPGFTLRRFALVP
jgi:hypothetical protein